MTNDWPTICVNQTRTSAHERHGKNRRIVGPGGLPSHCRINGLDCPTEPNSVFEPKRVFGELSNLNRPEQVIQRAVFEHLRLRAASNVFAFHPANGGWRSQVEAAILKGLGVCPGVPDVIAIKAGRDGLELKNPAGRLSPAQRDVLAALRAAGATVSVAYGLDAALAQLEAWELLRGGGHAEF
jgi:VRR-NUC domain